ncbi:MAG: hypothetical protein IPK32_01440 [Verrucomicrobiaceae bacterium]|nr:hypothetical protein [Verrucomicrobiaceae bacterium]
MIGRLFALVFSLSAVLHADVPLPPAVLQPADATEAWNIIRLATANTARLVRERRPLEVATQISLCSPALRMLARSPVKAGREGDMTQLTTRAFAQVNLLARDGMAENADGLPAVLTEFEKSLAELATCFDTAVVKSELYTCQMHPEVLERENGKKCPTCAATLFPRCIPYSFIHARAEKPGIQMAVKPVAPAQAGKEVKLTLTLGHADGTPVEESALWPMHTQKVHLIVTNADKKEFHHLAVKAVSTAGEYVAAFTPASAGTYRLHAALTPAGTGIPEYPAAELPVAGEAKGAVIPEGDQLSASAEGFKFQLSIAGTKGYQLRAGETQMLHLRVTDASGQPVNRLEPIWQAFAHLTAFYVESDTLLQLHPTGGDILREDLRGGPALAFKIYSPEVGTLRLHAQLRIDGKDIRVPFQARVMP